MDLSEEGKAAQKKHPAQQKMTSHCFVGKAEWAQGSWAEEEWAGLEPFVRREQCEDGESHIVINRHLGRHMYEL